MTIDTAALSKLSKAELVGLLSQVLTGDVAQAPTEAAKVPTPEEVAAYTAKAKCGRITSSTGEPCTRNATQDDGACKSHTGDWDNDEAKAKFAAGQAFVESRREANKNGSRREANKALSAALKAEGLASNGEPWAKAKALVAAGATNEAAAKAVKAAK